MVSHANVMLESFIDAAAIRRRVGDLVDEIARDFQGGEFVVVAVLKGSFMFAADLVRQLNRHHFPLLIDFCQVASYGSGTESSGTPALTRDLSTDLAGRAVLLVDDILDTGRTSAFVKEHLAGLKPAWLKTCIFLDKPGRRTVPFEPDYVGFRVPNAFVVGYGLDYDNRYRERPDLSLVRFTDAEPPRAFEFRIEDKTVFLEGKFDAAAVDWMSGTLSGWNQDLEMDIRGVETLDPAGVEYLTSLYKDRYGFGRMLRLMNTPAEMRDTLIQAGLGKSLGKTVLSRGT
jgi:hypoxanthine phosphoribosyltransferase